MAKWRAQIRLPRSLDTKIRAHAVDRKVNLTKAVQMMIDDGLAEIREDGAAHQFMYETLFSAVDVTKVEYVIDEKYRAEIDTVTAFITGKGKVGKALAETIGLGSRKRGL